jgi:cold shock protein
MQGKIKFFNEEKGFGFIESEEGDIFVHAKQCNGAKMKKGDNVEFTIGPGLKGDEAKDVTVTN